MKALSHLSSATCGSAVAFFFRAISRSSSRGGGPEHDISSCVQLWILAPLAPAQSEAQRDSGIKPWLGLRV